jgi:hypothetical protein
MNVLDPEVLNDPIYWPEGERDVSTLNKLGLLALTFGGASDLPEGCEQFVAARDVIICAGRRLVA